MIELNLIANNKQEEIVKNYLQENVSEILADKINNGVQIVKEDKTLINKKTLSGFMKFACEEARKQAEKGSNSACVEDVTVFGWAIHYFEEDSIEEKLFNEDGTEYKVEVKQQAKPTQKIEVKPKKESSQQTLFDFMNNDKDEKEELSYKAQLSQQSQPEPLEDEIEGEKVEETIKEEVQPHLLPNQKIDYNTGEIITIENKTFDKYQLKTISAIFEGKVKLQ